MRSFLREYLRGDSIGLQLFDFEVHDGISWISLNDGYRFKIGANSFANSSQTLSKTGAKSSIYDGEWIVHSTKENVEEQVELFIKGGTYAEVEAAAELVVEAFSQDTYYARLSLDDHVETWFCFPADYAKRRNHVNAHNRRTELVFSVPRLPTVTRGVRA